MRDNGGSCLPVSGFWVSEPSRFPRWHDPLALLAALALLQAPLWISPGYFSHDELQWGARAATATVRELPFVSFVDVERFQFRPLTFNLWLLLSHALFETPRLFHAVFVLLGALNALLLASVLRRAGCRAPVAFCAALVFGLSPFAVWVQGWVGCLGDLLWVGFALGIVRVLQRKTLSHSPPSAFPPSHSLAGEGELVWLVAASLTAALATLLALWSKEAALSIPALLALATLLLRLPRTWLAATLASAAIAVAYLALRLETLTAPGDAATYTLHATALPLRWLEYLAFPWALGVQEVHVLRLAAWSKWIVWLLAPLAFALCLWRASRRLWLACLAGSALALAPVLALPVSANQYGYGFAALCCGVAALAWERLRRGGRATLAVLALVAVAHGFQVQMWMLEVGRVQAVFSPSLAEQARAQPQGAILLWPEQPSQHPVYSRLSHRVPAYRGVPLGERVGMAESAEQATHKIAPDGRVRPRGAPP